MDDRADQSTWILLSGVLSTEEAKFFLVSVALIVFDTILFFAEETHSHMQEWFSKFFAKNLLMKQERPSIGEIRLKILEL
jgi:hypothetical protein